MKASELFDWPESLAVFANFFPLSAAPWEWIPGIRTALTDVEPSIAVNVPAGLRVEGAVYVDPSVTLPHTGTILGPAWIGPDCELRPGVFIRGNVIAGKGCVLGNACEFKNALLLDGVQVPHFSYVGDSVLGNRAHLGAGVICANLRLDQQPVKASTPDGKKATGLRKLGAILGDGAEVGCNGVLQPGTVLGRRAVVLSGLAYSGFVPDDTMVRARVETELVRRQS